MNNDSKEVVECSLLNKNSAIIIFNDIYVKGNDRPLEQVFNGIKEAFPDVKFLAVPLSIVSSVSPFNIDKDNTLVLRYTNKLSKDIESAIIDEIHKLYPDINVIFIPDSINWMEQKKEYNDLVSFTINTKCCYCGTKLKETVSPPNNIISIKCPKCNVKTIVKYNLIINQYSINGDDEK